MDAPRRIEVIAGGGAVLLAWDDGTTQELTAALLRTACPCAQCREPQGAEQARQAAAGPVPVEIRDAELVGSYAVNFAFGPDGHSTGIFTYDYLRDLEQLPARD